MGIYTRNGKYYIDYYDNRMQRHREYAGCTKREAEQALVIRKAEIAQNKFGIGNGRSHTIRLNALADRYLEYKKAHITNTSRIETIFRAMLPFFGNRFIDEITSLMVEDYKIKRSRHIKRNGEKISPACVNRELACLKHMYTMAITWGFIEHNPAKGVKLFRENNERLRYLTQDEAQRLVEAATPHLKPIIIMALNTGMRYGEIAALKWKDVDLDGRNITITRSKNGQMRKVPINENLYETLLAHKGDVPGDGYVFCQGGSGIPYKSVRKSFITATKAAGIDDFKFHDLRHTFASHLVMKGVGIATVKELLGHKTLAMTIRYSHLSDAHKKNAVNLVAESLNGNGSMMVQPIFNVHSQARIEPLPFDSSATFKVKGI